MKFFLLFLFTPYIFAEQEQAATDNANKIAEESGLSTSNWMMGATLGRNLASLALKGADQQRVIGVIDIASGSAIAKVTCPCVSTPTGCPCGSTPTCLFQCVLGISGVLNGVSSLKSSKKSKKAAEALGGDRGGTTAGEGGPNPSNNTCPDGSSCPANGVCLDGTPCRNNNACTPACTGGQICQNGTCTDPNNNTCPDGSSCPANGVCPNGGTCTPDCLDGKTWNGSECVSSNNNTCSDGSSCPANGVCPDGGTCTPDCPDGKIWDGSECASTGEVSCEENNNQPKCNLGNDDDEDACIPLTGQSCDDTIREACIQMGPQCRITPPNNIPTFFDLEGNPLGPGSPYDLGRQLGMTPDEIEQANREIAKAQKKAMNQLGANSSAKGKLKGGGLSSAESDSTADSSTENFKPSLTKGGGGSSSNNKNSRGRRGASAFSRQLQSLLDKNKKGHRADIKKHGYKPTKLGHQPIGTVHDNIFDMMSRGYQAREQSLNTP